MIRTHFQGMDSIYVMWAKTLAAFPSEINISNWSLNAAWVLNTELIHSNANDSS